MYNGLVHNVNGTSLKLHFAEDTFDVFIRHGRIRLPSNLRAPAGSAEYAAAVANARAAKAQRSAAIHENRRRHGRAWH